MNEIIMHINYGEVKILHYGKKTIDDICKMAANIGFDGIEFRGNPPVELSSLSYDEYIDEIGRCKNKYGLKRIVVCLATKSAFECDKDNTDKEIDKIALQAKKAYNVCGTDVFNTFASPIVSSLSSAPKASYEFHGSYAATQEDWDKTVIVYQKLGKKLEDYGLKFAFETHMNYIHDLPAPTKKLVDLIDSPQIGINMDFGNVAYFPGYPDLEETIDLYNDKLFYTHLKNSNGIPEIQRRLPCALSEGEINHRIYLSKLKEIGFKGPIGIEAPRPGDREWYARCDFNYVKSLINDIY